MGAEKINEHIHSKISSKDSFIIQDHKMEIDFGFNNSKKQEILASDHINRAQKYVPEDLLSKNNFDNIQSISQMFPGNLTTFLGFETRLWEEKNNADFAFAISGIGEDRKVLTSFLENEVLSKKLLKISEWQQIYDFSKTWSDSKSDLYDKVQCFWIEFDMSDDGIGTLIPSVFFGPSKKYSHNDCQYDWLINTAIPLLSRSKIPENISNLILETIKKMPDNATLFQVGTMLSREISTIRLHINKLKPSQIIPYLIDIGWNYDSDELHNLINDFKDLVDRFVISYDILNGGIGPKIGIELSFEGNNFQHEEQWIKVLDYLVDNGMCIPQKRDALLHYSGLDEDTSFSGGIMKPIHSATLYSNDLNQSEVLRYINHVKIVYEPGKSIMAKAYPAVRLFEINDLRI